MLRIQPRRRSRMPASTTCASSKGARTWTSNITWNRRLEKSVTGRNQVTAALLTRTSIGPSSVSVVSTRRRRSSGEDRSARPCRAPSLPPVGVYDERGPPAPRRAARWHGRPAAATGGGGRHARCEPGAANARQSLTMGDTVLYEVRDGVARVTLNRPERRNAINPAMRDELAACAQRIDEAAEVRVMVLTGAGTAFCSGMDLRAFSEGERSRSGPGGTAFPTLPSTKPAIAAVNGPAVAGGFELVLGCDLAVAAEEAVFGLSEVQVGLFAAGGGVFRLPRVAGLRPAMEMLLTGQRIDARRALELGIVNHVVPAADVVARAEEIAARVAAAAPLGVAETLAMARRALDLPEEDLWHLNRAAWSRVASSEDAMEGARAFVEKRPARWKGR